VSATAHPAKFETIVEPVIGRAVPVPPALAELLKRPTASTPLAPQLPRFAAELDGWK
jgi:threonine synthase